MSNDSVSAQDFTQVREGDTVIRSLAGMIDLKETVVKVDSDYIYTDYPDDRGNRFDRKTGFEYDPGLGLPDGVVATFLKGWTRDEG